MEGKKEKSRGRVGWWQRGCLANVISIESAVLVGEGKWLTGWRQAGDKSVRSVQPGGEEREGETWGCVSVGVKAKRKRTRAGQRVRCQGGSHGHWGTRRKCPHDFAALPLYYKEGNVGCNLCVTCMSPAEAKFSEGKFLSYKSIPDGALRASQETGLSISFG